MTTPSPADLEAMAAALEASGDYRVLRRLKSSSGAGAPDGLETRLGLYLDVETTGLDANRDEIIELAMVPFTYGLDGQIHAVGEPFHGLQQPSVPIPPEITAITGLDDAMVAGHALDLDAVRRFAAPAALIIAHNAAFDRKFVERLCDVFTTKAWACSMDQVDWRAEGYEGVKLVHLATSSGFFYERHRAVHDCHAGVELLTRPLASTGRPALAQLLERARKVTVRIWAEHSPFELKDQLKARGYRWNAEGNASPRAWYVDVDEADREAELRFLAEEIYQREVELMTTRVTAYDRYSDRV